MKTDKDYLRQLGNMLGDGVRHQWQNGNLPNFLMHLHVYCFFALADWRLSEAKSRKEFGTSKLIL